jgi:anti-sigma regulatory factor (Ser/Thr protein kinase)
VVLYEDWVAADLEGPAQARRILSGLLPAQSLGEEAEKAVLLTSELVTNAILHGDVRTGSSIRVGVGRTSQGRIRIEVDQPGHAADMLRDHINADPVRLNIMRSAVDWGAESSPVGVAWFELRRSDVREHQPPP